MIAIEENKYSHVVSPIFPVKIKHANVKRSNGEKEHKIS